MKHRESDKNIIDKLQNHISLLEGKVSENQKVVPVTEGPELKRMEAKLAEALSKVQELQKENVKRSEKEQQLEEALKQQKSEHNKDKGHRGDDDDDMDTSDEESEDPSRTFLKTADGTEVFWLYAYYIYKYVYMLNTSMCEKIWFT